MVKKSVTKNYFWRYLLAIVFILIVLELLLVIYSPSELNIENEGKFEPVFIQEGDLTLLSMMLPAVDSDGNGVSTVLFVEAMPGSGRTLTDIDNLLFWADTQHSIRIARLVAGELSEEDVNNYDLIYSIKANASIIGGPSAGAALAIATIAAIEGKSVREDVMITGTINRDGSIGPVSEILAKAKAAGDAGAKTFLVPLLQSRDIVYESEDSCETFGTSELCTTETKPRKVNLTEETGVQVIEVGSIEEALKYFY
ncbi:MAG: S16 family serine protease [archaeon]